MRLKDMIDGQKESVPFDLIFSGICKLAREEKLFYRGLPAYKIYDDNEEVVFFLNAHYRIQVISSKKIGVQEDDGEIQLSK